MRDAHYLICAMHITIESHNIMYVYVWFHNIMWLYVYVWFHHIMWLNGMCVLTHIYLYVYQLTDLNAYQYVYLYVYLYVYQHIYLLVYQHIYMGMPMHLSLPTLRQNGTRKGGLSWEIAKERSALCNDMYIGLFWHVYRSLLTQETHSRSLQREREFSSERLEREWLSWVKRDLYTCQKRPIYVSKETNIHVKWERPSSLLSALCNSLCSRAVCTLPLYTKTREHAGSLSAENRD